jgi:hypothetical protein
MALRLFLTDGDGIQGIVATFGAIINTQIADTAANAAAAAASAAAALASQGAAAGSASAASTYANSASASATSASGSAATATTEAGIATTQAGNAAASATSASGYATAASTSATNAATSATNAANSATAAATSASNAAATLANALVKANNLSDVANATTARGNLTAAKSGANSDITALSGLTTPLSITQGGTGAASASAALTALGTQPTNNPTFTGNVGVGTRAVGDSTVNAASTAFVMTAIAPMIGFNRLINAEYSIDQRNNGAAQTIVSGANLVYTVDRWYAYCTGANVTGQRVAGAAGTSEYRYQFTGAASVTGITHGQRIETVNSYDLAGTTATLSVDLANSLLTTVTWTAYYANTVDTFGTVASPTKTQIATGTFTVTGAVTRYSTSIAIPSAAVTGIEVDLSVGAQTSGTWTVGRVKLEPGSIATPFDKWDYTYNFLRCARYFWSSYLTGQNPGMAGAAISYQGYSNSATSYITIGCGIYPVQFRAAPTVTIYSPHSGSAGYYYQNNGTTDATGSAGGTDRTFYISPNGNGPNGGGMQVNLTASAEL